MRLERLAAVYAGSIAIGILLTEGAIALFGLTGVAAFGVGAGIGFVLATVGSIVLYDWTHEPRRTCKPDLITVPSLNRTCGPPEPRCIHGNYDYRASSWSSIGYCCEMAIDIAYAKSPALPKVDGLPAFRLMPKCPKCHSAAVETAYRGGAHEDCPDRRLNLFLSRFADAAQIAFTKRKTESGIEHHDRSCLICKHRWVEAVA